MPVSRDIKFRYNGTNFSVIVQDGMYKQGGWSVSVSEEKSDGWYRWVGNGRFYIGEIRDWIWASYMVGAVADAQGSKIEENTPLHKDFKESLERSIVHGCMDLLNG